MKDSNLAPMMVDTPDLPEPVASKTAVSTSRWQFWRREKKPKRALLVRLFGVSVWGGVKLVLVCILVGFVMLAMQFDPTDPAFNARAAIGELAQNAVNAARLAVVNFWYPALTGASIVLPIWVLWRLATLPFRK
ncbi:MAG: hypothetical protein AAFY34_11865 [Pseudomonadota bacterium]